MAVYYSTESLAKARFDIQKMVDAHDAEVMGEKDTSPLDIDWGWYEGVEMTRALEIYTARVRGTLVGYALFLLAFDPHRKTQLVATNDLLYVIPEMRGGFVASRLLRHAETHLASQRKVDKISCAAPKNSEMGRLLAGSGYHEVETVNVKVIKWQ